MNATKERLGVFVDRIMRPIPGGALLDMDLSRIMRQQRREAWRRKRREYEFYRALHRVARYAEEFSPDGVQVPDSELVLIEMHRAHADLLVAPAPGKAEVLWKRRELEKRAYLPARREDVEASCVDDGAFLAAHPVTTRSA
jgi:hypothetical protein